MHTSSKRQLAAILFADIVGYSALMQQDELAAIAKLNHFKQQIHEKTSHYNGQIIQFYGDGCLITFNSASDAAACAAALQIIFQEIPLVPTRIGIHSGEVLFKEGNIFGDSVNITSRIEAITYYNQPKKNQKDGC